MAKRVYFNEHLKDNSRAPKIVIQDDDGDLIYCNYVRFTGGTLLTTKTGKIKAPVHDVIAWIECEDNEIEWYY